MKFWNLRFFHEDVVFPPNGQKAALSVHQWFSSKGEGLQAVAFIFHNVLSLRQFQEVLVHFTSLCPSVPNYAEDLLPISMFPDNLKRDPKLAEMVFVSQLLLDFITPKWIQSIGEVIQSVEQFKEGLDAAFKCRLDQSFA